MIKISNLSKYFGKHKILENIDMTLPDTGLITIFGESGSGKSTLLNIIGGMINDYKGDVVINNINLHEFDENQIRTFRLKNIGYVFQNYNLLELETVYQNIKLPLDTLAVLDEQIKKQRVLDAMEITSIAKLKDKNINVLSGGEKQRVAISRAIINSPSILLCDEPTGALDEQNTTNIYALLKKLSIKCLVIVASHDESIKEYADKVLAIEDGKIMSLSQNGSSSTKNIAPLIGEDFPYKKPAISIYFKLFHSFHKMKCKKFRTLIVNTILSLSLVGIGMSLLLSNSISSKVESAISSLTNGNQIVMSLKDDRQNPINGVYTLPYEKLIKVKEKYSYMIDGIGTTYMVNFENFFKDKNSFYISTFGQKYEIASLSTRNINDFRLIDNSYRLLTYPYLKTELEDDELILGLNYVDMVNVCYKLQLQRSYSALGEYIRNNDFYLTLEIENKSWQYDDEQIFLIRGVCQSGKSCFYHYDELWNQTVFEKMMRLPSDDDNQLVFPWEMYKLYYLRTIEDPGKFINASLVDEENYDYVFERTNYQYHPLLCEIGEVCKEKRVIAYYVDKEAIDPSIISLLKKSETTITNYYYVSDYGYASYASNVVSGFSKNLFVSLSKKLIDEAIDADTSLDDEKANISLPNGIVKGNYLDSLSNGLKFSTKVDSFIEGRMPLHNGEIAISQGLNEKLGGDAYGKNLFISGIVNESLNQKEQLEKEYQTAEVVIVGIINEDKNYLYHNCDWSISFFRDNLGVSMFNLIPRSIVFEFDNNADTSFLCERYNSLFKDYKFSSPKDEMSKSLDSTLKYVNVIVGIFSFLSLMISAILLGTIVMLNVKENAKELEMLKYLGISKKESESIFTIQSLLQGIIAFISASFQLIIVSILISYAIDGMMNIKSGFCINPLPFLIIFLVAVILPIVVSKITLFIFSKKKSCTSS